MNHADKKHLTKTDKTGTFFYLSYYAPGNLSCLMEMYNRFSPKPACQGIPSPDPEFRNRWIKDLIRIGENFLAWHEQEVIGHAALIPDAGERSGEYVIFVHQDYRNRGIGTELTREILDRAIILGFESVWLTVEIANSVASRFYVKLGFQYCDMNECERIMRITF